MLSYYGVPLQWNTTGKRAVVQVGPQSFHRIHDDLPGRERHEPMRMIHRLAYSRRA
jgi:hypothetical protein